MRLYRGLKEPYRIEKLGAAPAGAGPFGTGTDFTDCPVTALQYARARRGIVLVLDVADGRPRVSEELWPNSRAKRLMVWGWFDDLIVASIPAKELRVHVRRKGVVAESDEYKALVLKSAIEGWIESANASASRPRRR